MKIFLRLAETITPTKIAIDFVHFMPFDETYGMNKTESELNETGILLEMPEELPEQQDKIKKMYYNPQTNTAFWEYEDIPLIPLTPEQQEIANLKAQVADLNVAMAALMGGAV